MSVKLDFKRTFQYFQALCSVVRMSSQLFPNNSDVVALNKLYKTNLFTKNDIRFHKGKLHEDSFTTYKLYYYSNKVTFTNVPFYYYLQRNDSITGEKFSIRRLEDTLSALEETEAFVENHNIIDLK